MDLKGKTALVTGGAKRIEGAIALALAGAGADVAVHYNRSEAEAHEIAGEIERLGARAWTVQADLSKQDEARDLVKRTRREAGPLAILVNNASTFPYGGFDEITRDDLATSIDVNAWAPYRLGRDFAAQASAGHIINLLDTRVKGYDWDHVGYHAAKHLLALFTRMMAVRFAPRIAVNAIAPGLILPPEGKDESTLHSLKDTNPLKRIGSPGEVADAALFLVRSRFITGQVIFIDGGRHLREAELT